jgi:hypothetical protein
VNLDSVHCHCGAIVELPPKPLQPQRPPGRADRKAAVYAGEIVRLRAEGYTFAVIREALAVVGIQVSDSALRREVRRHQKHSLPMRPETPAPQTPPPVTAAPPSKTATGREIAEAFFNAHPGNPLFPNQETP